MEVRSARHAQTTRRRSTPWTPLLVVGLLAVFVGLVVLPSRKANHPTPATEGSSLLDPGADLLVRDCRAPFDGSATVHFPEGSFDLDQLVRVTASDSGGWASGGGTLFPTMSTIVRVHVPAGTSDGDYAMAVSAKGTRDGKAVARYATFTVRVRCSAR